MQWFRTVMWGGVTVRVRDRFRVRARVRARVRFRVRVGGRVYAWGGCRQPGLRRDSDPHGG